MSLNKKEIVARLAETHGLTKAKAEEVVGFTSQLIIEQLSKGEDLVLPGVGRFSIKERAARTGRNPQTGAEMKIPAAKLVKFSPAKPLRDAAAGSKKAKKK